MLVRSRLVAALSSVPWKSDVLDVVGRTPNSPLIQDDAGKRKQVPGFLDSLAREILRRELIDVEAVNARTLRVGGRDYVNLASNDYLGLRFHQALIQRAADWAKRYGTGSGASRLVTGNFDLFAGIEAKVAKLKGKPSALVMASGFQAVAAVLAALFDRTCSAPSRSSSPTALNHASMHFGCKAAGIREIRYRHGDAGHLGELLTQYQGDQGARNSS